MEDVVYRENWLEEVAERTADQIIKAIEDLRDNAKCYIHGGDTSTGFCFDVHSINCIGAGKIHNYFFVHCQNVQKGESVAYEEYDGIEKKIWRCLEKKAKDRGWVFSTVIRSNTISFNIEFPAKA